MSNHQSILIVDDEPDFLDSIESILKADGDSVLKAPNGAAALAMVEAHTNRGGAPAIKAIVSDITMPVMNGLELLTKIRSTVEFQDIPVLLISGKIGASEVVSLAKYDPDAILLKPFGESVLKEQILKAIAVRENKKVKRSLALL